MEKRRPAARKKPKSTNDRLDDALDKTFPASDPLSQTEPTAHIGIDKAPEKPGRKP